MSTNAILKLSEELLLVMKMERSPTGIIQQVESLSLEDLKRVLQSDDEKKAFWINAYNAYFLILRKHNKLDKSKIYGSKDIVIAGQNFSLDEIEHGILRKYRIKFSLGYLPNLFAPKLIKELAVSKLDYRIHFALNCGAKSCPPIGFYAADRIDQLLDLASLSFLESETTVDDNNKQITVSRLLKWYIGDFGGKTGIKKILAESLKIKTKGYRLLFNEYNWDEDLDNFTDIGTN